MTPLESLFIEAYEEDATPMDIIKELENEKRHRKDISLALCGIENGRVRYNKKLYVPEYEPL
jgi:hypothetical protein